MNANQPVTQFANLADLKGDGQGGGVLATGSRDAMNQALAVIDKAIGDVASVRGKMGSLEADFLTPTNDSFQAAYQSLQESQASITDTDMAKEMASLTSSNIKSQVRLALMAQGKENTNTLLQLLK